MIFIGSRLQSSHPAIAAKMNINVDQIEEQWAELKHDIGRAEQTLHQAQMELLPSRQALNELITFINKLQNVFKEDKKKPINKMNKIGPMLNKYKVSLTLLLTDKNIRLNVLYIKNYLFIPGLNQINIGQTEELLF